MPPRGTAAAARPAAGAFAVVRQARRKLSVPVPTLAPVNEVRTAARTLTVRELNRALLARQGLLERLPVAPTAAVERVGALQMQYWPSLGPALWSRITPCPPEAPFAAHASGELVTGTLLRGTIHTVSAADYPAYAVVTGASAVSQWRHPADPPPAAAVAELRAELLAYAARPRTVAEVCAFIESWVARNPGVFGEAELTYQRRLDWRPFCGKVWLVRVPRDGRWDGRRPSALQAAPVTEGPEPDEALRTVIRRHLAAFGPAAAEDVANWIGWNRTPVRAALRAMDDLVAFADEAGRVLYDLPDAPRPGPDVTAPVRLLPWFDSVLLAYLPGRRARILPERHRDEVFDKRNGRVKACFLVDGMVAGTWSVDATRRAEAVVTLTPFEPVPRAARDALLAEAEAMARFCRPDAPAHRVRVEEVR